MLRLLRNAYKIEVSRPRGRSESMSTFSPRLTLHFLCFRAQKSLARIVMAIQMKIERLSLKICAKMTSSSPKQESKFSSSFFFLQESYCVVKI